MERLVWDVSSLADNYLIEGVDFLRAQLAAWYPIQPVFLGCSAMTLERFDPFPGRSPGYARLPQEIRRQLTQDIPHWSAFSQQEAKAFGDPYIDISDDFPTRLSQADAVGAFPE